MPFRIAFLPLRLLGTGLEAGVGYIGPRYFEPKPKRPPKQGLALGPYVTCGSVNDIGVGPAITWVGFPTADSKLLVAGSWSPIDRRRVHVSEAIGDRRPVTLRLRADYDYKPNRRYYGIGNNTPEADLSYFLLASTKAEGALVLGASPLRQLRIGGGFTSLTPLRGYHGQPLLEEKFTPTSAPYEHRTMQELWYGVAGDLATLDDARDPSLGVHGRFDLRRAAGLRARDLDYDQWRVEARAYLPVFAKRRVIAVRGVFAGIDPRGGNSTTLPFYLLAQSEGTSRFAGYASERFRDRQLMLVRIEYRWMILYRISALGLFELGQVAPRTGSFSIRGAHRSYGGGLRYGLSDRATLRLELAKSVEGFQAVVSMGSDF
jgi:outer membrane protein assembly factor BamA